MPFKLKLNKKHKYNVMSKNLFVISVELLGELSIIQLKYLKKIVKRVKSVTFFEFLLFQWNFMNLRHSNSSI